MSVIEDVISICKQQKGKPYVYGSTGPDSFDCSGLIYYAFGQLGISIGRTTYSMLSDSKFDSVSVNSLQRGDLVFPSSQGHVLLYLGENDSNGRYIHAPHTGDVVKFTNSYNDISYGLRYNGAGAYTDNNGDSTIIGTIQIGDGFPKNYKPRVGPGKLKETGKTLNIKSGAILTVYEKRTVGNQEWGRITQGWIPLGSFKGDTSYTTYTSTYDSVTESSTFDMTIDKEQYEIFLNNYLKTQKDTYYSNYVNSVSTQMDKDEAGNLFLKNPRGIHGLPYQYNQYVDRRLPDSKFGRKYAEKIISKMPLLLLSPGRPKFMGTFTNDEKKNILTYLGEVAKGSDNSIANLIEDKKQTGLLYDFEFAYVDYYNYVNPLCQITAKYMGIEDKKIDGTALTSFLWQNFTNKEFKTYFSAAETVAFYIDAETQVSESFGNDTTKSSLADQINSLSSLGKEMQFLLGGENGPIFDFLKMSNYDNTSDAFQEWVNNNLSILPKSLVSRLTESGLNIVTGGKMIFPEIWEDSTFSKSYSIKIKLRSPDCDDFSIYMNILVPLIHLICLVAPQSKGNSSYNSPFIIRGFYKSIFNCNLGIITDMSINKGNTAKWNSNGLPTEVDIDFTIKDLYQLLTITSQTTSITDKYSVDVLSNTLLMDYIANMCGVNINKPDILRTIDLYAAQIYNRSISPLGRLNRGMLTLEQQLGNSLKGLASVFSFFK